MRFDSAMCFGQYQLLVISWVLFIAFASLTTAASETLQSRSVHHRKVHHDLATTYDVQFDSTKIILLDCALYLTY